MGKAPGRGSEKDPSGGTTDPHGRLCLCLMRLTERKLQLPFTFHLEELKVVESTQKEHLTKKIRGRATRWGPTLPSAGPAHLLPAVPQRVG